MGGLQGKMKRDVILRFYLHIIKPLLDKVPYLRKILRNLWEMHWKFRLKLKSFHQSADLHSIYWISPQEITYALREEFPIYKYKGNVLDGDWDLPHNLIKFEELDIYQALYQHFIEGKEWQETDFYHRVLAEIESGMIKWNCLSNKDFEERCKKLDALYQDIKNNGFETQKKLRGGVRKMEDEIAVVIGRNGDLIFNNGRHRLAIAKILDLDKIPVKITLRHKRWVEF